MMTLTPPAHAYLAGLTYSPHAEGQENWMPLTTLVWADEFKEGELFDLEAEDRESIFTLFRIRRYFWLNEEVTPEALAYWQTCAAAYPTCPIFQRATPKDDWPDRQRRLETRTWDFLDESGFEPANTEEGRADCS